MRSPASSAGSRSPSTPLGFPSSGPKQPKSPKRTRPLLRNLNLTRLFPLPKVQTTSAEGAVPFTPIHAPDRPGQLTPASAAPSEQECKEFFMAFRSPKSFGFPDDVDEGDDRRISGIDMSLWRPWLLSGARSPVDESGPGKDARRQTLSPMTAFSESPLLQEAMVVRTADSGAARLVNVDARTKTPPSEVEGSRGPTRLPEENPRPRQNSFFATLQEARTRSSLLASYRAAARGSMEARDSGYKSWRGSNQSQEPADGGASPRTDRSVNCHSPSSWSSSSMFSRYSSIKPGGLGHVAHQLAQISQRAPRPPSREAPPPNASFSGTRLSAVTGSESRATPTSLCCHCGGRESDVEEEPDLGLYGDWAEYYFKPENFRSTNITESIQTARGPQRSRASSLSRMTVRRRSSGGISPNTSWYDPDEGSDAHQQEPEESNQSYSSQNEGTNKAVCPIQRAITKGRREAFTYRTRRELMEVPGYRFEHESYGEALARQEFALGPVWTRSYMTDGRLFR